MWTCRLGTLVEAPVPISHASSHNATQAAAVDLWRMRENAAQYLADILARHALENSVRTHVDMLTKQTIMFPPPDPILTTPRHQPV